MLTLDNDKFIKQEKEDITNLMFALLFLVLSSCISLVFICTGQKILCRNELNVYHQQIEMVILQEKSTQEKIITTEQETQTPPTNEERVCILVDKICDEMNFNNSSLIKGMIYCESSFNKNCISSAGSMGLMQITPRYFTELMEMYSVTDLCNDEVGNIRIGIHWINYLINKYEGDLHKALVAYNCGESYVDVRGYTESGYSRKVLRMAGEY